MDDSMKKHSQFCSSNSKCHDSPPPSPQKKNTSNNAEEEARCRQAVEIISGGGDTSCLKMEHCRAYMRKHLIRMRGTKQEMIERIREHLELKDNGGVTKYPVDSFVVDCTGDVHVGDTILFQQNVYEKTISKASALPPLGERIVAGRVVKESSTLCRSSRASTFTVEILWTRGVSSLPPLYALIVSRRELYELYTYRQLRPSEEASIRTMKKQAREEANIRAMKEKEVTAGPSSGAALKTPKTEVQGEGEGKGKGKLKGEDPFIDRDKGKLVLVNLEDDSNESTAKDDNEQHTQLHNQSTAKEDKEQHTQSHNPSTSQEQEITEIAMKEEECNNPKKMQGKQSSSVQVHSNDLEHKHELPCPGPRPESRKDMQEETLKENVHESSHCKKRKDMQEKKLKENVNAESSHCKKRKDTHEEKLKRKDMQKEKLKENVNAESSHCKKRKDMQVEKLKETVHESSHCKNKRKYKKKRKYMQEENVQQADEDGLFQNLEHGQDDSKMEVPGREIQSNISVDPPCGSNPTITAGEKYKQWCSITPSLNTKLGNNLHGEKSKNIYDGEVLPDLSGEVTDHKDSVAGRSCPHQGDKKKNSKRQMRQYLWHMRKRMKHHAIPRRQHSRITSTKGGRRPWPFHVKCHISDCPQKAAIKCVNKLCRSCCVAVSSSCIRHHS